MNLSASSLGLSDAASGLVGATPSHAPIQSAAATVVNLGLVIEDDKAAGEYVYKTVNRATGQVVSQWPSQQLLQLSVADNYSPGGIFRQIT